MPVEFTSTGPEEFLKPEAMDKYREEMEHFHLSLSLLNTDLYIVEKILRFPFELFTIGEENLFFKRVMQNFYQTTILEITKLATDSGSDATTLPKFKNFMAKSIKVEYQDEYRLLLGDVKFDATTKDLLRRAKLLRDTQIAHSLNSSPESIIPLSFAEIKTLFDGLARLFEVASFSSQYGYHFASYNPENLNPDGTPALTDIEEILDSVAKESSILNCPENHPETWPLDRERWPQSTVDVFNRYRRKFSLPEV